MKVLFLISCFALGAYADRVKRVVGGEKAAIPQPLPALSTTSTPPATKTTGSTSSGKGTTVVETRTSSSVDTSSSNSVSIFEEERTAKVNGIKEKEGYIAFKGIPYAKPPLNRNRFQRPILEYLKGEIDAFDYGSPCVQLLPDESDTIGKEDCLYLNVYTPSVYSKNASGLPVLFWIHGGGFMRGSGNQYGARDLVKKNLVVVTMNYRLGTLGFLGSSNKQMSGNAALFDIRAAFEWTRRYITYFGGNPRRIFTAGQGSGASVALLFAQSDFTAGFVQGVLAMSGTGVSSNAVDYAPDNTSAFISQTTNCNGLDELQTVKCLQNCDLKYIINVQKELTKDRIGNKGGFVNAISKLLTAGPMVEGKNDGRFLPFFLTQNPLDALKDNATTRNIPLLIGTTKSETGKSLTGKYKADVELSLKIPDFLNKVLPRDLLHNNVGLFTAGVVNKLLEKLFDSDTYLGLITGILGEGVSPFLKVIQTTTDALFNLPAATTSNLWDGEAYFYSFEYQSEKVQGNSFLDGLALHSGSTQSTEKLPGHGDDLVYLFECQTIEGKPITKSTLTESKDLKVKEIFVTMVAEYLKTGKPRLPNSKKEWRPFTEDNNYGVVSDQPEIKEKFRYCELALWGGLTNILKTPFCTKLIPDIAGILDSLPTDLLKKGIVPWNDLTMIKIPADPLNKVGPGLAAINLKPTGNPSLPNLPIGGGGMKMKSTTMQNTKQTSTTEKSSLLRPQVPVFGGIGR